MKLSFFIHIFLAAAMFQQFVLRTEMLYKKACNVVSEHLKSVESNYKLVKENIRNKIQEFVDQYNEKALKKRAQKKPISNEEFKQKFDEIVQKSAEIGADQAMQEQKMKTKNSEETEKKEL